MTAGTKQEGRILMAFLAGLGGALGALAKHPTSSAAPPEVGDALDDAVRGIQHAERAVKEALDAEPIASDPWTRCLPKILSEVTFSMQGFVTILTTWYTSWWTRRLSDRDSGFPYQPGADDETEADRGNR